MAARLPLELLYNIVLINDDIAGLAEPPFITNRSRHPKPCARAVSHVCSRWYHFVRGSKLLFITTILMELGPPTSYVFDSAQTLLETSDGSEVDIHISAGHPPYDMLDRRNQVAEILPFLTPWFPHIRILRASLHSSAMDGVWKFFSTKVELPRLRMLIFGDEDSIDPKTYTQAQMPGRGIDIFAPLLANAIFGDVAIQSSSHIIGLSAIQQLHLLRNDAAGLNDLLQRHALGEFLEQFPNLRSLRLTKIPTAATDKPSLASPDLAANHIQKLHITASSSNLFFPLTELSLASLRFLQLEMTQLDNGEWHDTHVPRQLPMPNLESLTLKIEASTVAAILLAMISPKLSRLSISISHARSPMPFDPTYRVHADSLKVLVFRSFGSGLDQLILEGIYAPNLERALVAFGGLPGVVRPTMYRENKRLPRVHCIKLEGHDDLHSLEAVGNFNGSVLSTLDMTNYGSAACHYTRWKQVCGGIMPKILMNLRNLSINATSHPLSLLEVLKCTLNLDTLRLGFSLSSSLHCISLLGDRKHGMTTVPVPKLRVLQLSHYCSIREPEVGGPYDVILNMLELRGRNLAPLKVVGISGVELTPRRIQTLAKHVFYLTINKDTCHHVFQIADIDNYN